MKKRMRIMAIALAVVFGGIGNRVLMRLVILLPSMA